MASAPYKLVRRDPTVERKVEELCEKGFLPEAVELVRNHSRKQGDLASHAMLYATLRKCTRVQDLEIGRRMHCLAVNTGLQFEPYLHRLLIQMYAACGSLLDADRVFGQHRAPDIFAWTEMISTNARSGRAEQGIELYGRMQGSGVSPDGHAYVAALKCSMGARNIGIGKLLHAQIVEDGAETDSFVRNTLIGMHAKLGTIGDARDVFEKCLPKRDVVAHGVMIEGYLESGLLAEAMQVFDQMKKQGVKPDRAAILSILKAISALGDLHRGRLLHVHTLVLGLGLELDLPVLNSIVGMYLKCGSLEDATRVFDRLSSGRRRDVVTVNVMMSGLALFEQHAGICRLYGELVSEGVSPTHVTVANVLRACAVVGGGSRAGRWMHSDALESGFCSRLLVASNLVDMYARCGSVEDAESVFWGLPEKNAACCNAILCGYAPRRGDDGIRVFQAMLHAGIEPDGATFAGVLKCAGDLWHGRAAHCRLRELEAKHDSQAMNAVMEMYMKCGSADDAFRAFEGIEKSRGTAAWNAIVARCMEHGHEDRVPGLLERMAKEGVEPDVATYSCMLRLESSVAAAWQGRSVHFLIAAAAAAAVVLDDGLAGNSIMSNSSVMSNSSIVDSSFIASGLIGMYSKQGRVEEARHVFRSSADSEASPSSGGVAHVITWNAMLEGYVCNGRWQSAWQAFEHMRQAAGIEPDRGTWIARLKSVCALRQGKLVHAQIRETFHVRDLLVANSLLDMYGRCGSLDAAVGVFREVDRPDAVLWCSIVDLCARFGNHALALRCFEQMRQEHRGIDAAFCALLSSSGHVGADPPAALGSIADDDAVASTALMRMTYNCLVDLLGRAGRLDEALDCLKLAPLEPDPVAWISLLSHSRAHDHLGLATLCFDRLSDSHTNRAAQYVLLSRLYAENGLMEDAELLEAARKSRGLWKTPGRAVVEAHGGGVHEFVGGNVRLLPREILAKLKRLRIGIKAQGYVPL